MGYNAALFVGLVPEEWALEGLQEVQYFGAVLHCMMFALVGLEGLHTESWPDGPVGVGAQFPVKFGWLFVEPESFGPLFVGAGGLVGVLVCMPEVGRQGHA